jgi:serine incorporator 1/3
MESLQCIESTGRWECYTSSLLPFSLASALPGTPAPPSRMGPSPFLDVLFFETDSLCRWWGPKIMAWAVLVVISFFIPNSFFIIWANYFAMAGSVLFILYGLILLIDAAHSWAEMCLEKYEATESRAWELVLVGSTFGMYAAALAMVVISYIFFAQSGCGLNQTFVSLNLVFAVLCTGMAIHPRIQEANSRSGLAQSAMVCIYATYLTLSAVCNGSPPFPPQILPCIKAIADE